MTKTDLLHIAIVQYDLAWLAVSDNLNYLEGLDFKAETDLIILPEMFATGFCMQPELIANPYGASIVNWMSKFSSKQQKGVCGSVAIEENGKYYNRFFMFYKGNCMATYNKRHLFTYSGEDKVYTAGDELVLFDFLGWKICPQICYDLRFPVWFRNKSSYDLLLNVANWPENRTGIWDNLLQARAIENMSYVIGCNRIGEDGNHLHYTGHSGVYFPSTEKVNYEENAPILFYTLSKQKLINYRSKYPFLEDGDSFTINF